MERREAAVKDNGTAILGTVVERSLGQSEVNGFVYEHRTDSSSQELVECRSLNLYLAKGLHPLLPLLLLRQEFLLPTGISAIAFALSTCQRSPSAI